MNTINIIHGDGVKALESMKENQYGLAIVDTPYGIGESGKSNKSRSKKTNFGAKNTKNTIVKAKDYKPFHGEDLKPPSRIYFEQLKIISKNQIIWGGKSFFKVGVVMLVGLG